jgi:CheY-like chemotaxis protein
MVVDDEVIVCDCIKMMLEYHGHDVQTANSGRAALALFEKGKFDLIFLDYSMPEMKGDELAATINALAPDQPIVMITGNLPNRATLPGVNFIVGKPVMLDELKEAIARVVRERSFAE